MSLLIGVCPICTQAQIQYKGAGRRPLTCGTSCAQSYRALRQSAMRNKGRTLEALQTALSVSERLPTIFRVKLKNLYEALEGSSPGMLTQWLLQEQNQTLPPEEPAEAR